MSIRTNVIILDIASIFYAIGTFYLPFTVPPNVCWEWIIIGVSWFLAVLLIYAALIASYDYLKGNLFDEDKIKEA